MMVRFPQWKFNLSEGRLPRIVLCLVTMTFFCACSSPAQPTFRSTQTTTLTPTYVAPPPRLTPSLPSQAEPLPAARPTDCQSTGGCASMTTPADPEPTVQATPRPPFDPATWTSLPIIPQLSAHAIAVLKQGLARGKSPRAFSKIGDCESRTTWFLGDFDLGGQNFHLGPYENDLAPVVVYYSGSFNRLSQAARPGFTAASLLSPLWSDRQVCQKNETPLACEYRVQKPAVAFIMLGTNDAVNPKTFEGHMRKILDYTLAQGVLPILGTKADNVEKDHQINQTISRLAYEYDVPLWNFWLAVQDLPGKGLQEDGSHLTFAAPFFDDPNALRSAWPVRNLNALQILMEVMQQTQ
jgi:hypothetical protein